LNLDGDGQGDLAGHGGEQRAVFVYQIESYRYWQEQLKRTDFVHGQFGENFTIEGLPDDAVCIGDRYQIGSALFEVTQPRVTCYRVGIRMNEPRMPALLTASGRPGFYFRVLREGEVGAGDEIVKVADAKERMTVAEINALLYSPNHSRDRLQRALRIEALSPGWRSSFEALLQSASSGNAGLAPAAAAHPVAPGFRPLAVTAIDHESADVLSLTMQSARSTAANGFARPIRGLTSSTGREQPATFSLLLAFGRALGGALSNQREDRVEWGRWNVPAGPCPRRR
jgi:MOSC domain-containing protein YiiM